MQKGTKYTASSGEHPFSTPTALITSTNPHNKNRRFVLRHGDMTDSSSLIRVMQMVQPDEVYNLAAQSHVACARDYVEMQWLMLQQSQPEDFVIATDRQYSVRDL